MSSERDRDTVIREGHEAAILKDNTLLTAILAEIEQDGVERAVSAAITDDATRAAAMAEIRAARSLASKLELRIAEAASLGKRRGGFA
jgi:hypothetical protein